MDKRIAYIGYLLFGAVVFQGILINSWQHSVVGLSGMISVLVVMWHYGLFNKEAQ